MSDDVPDGIVFVLHSEDAETFQFRLDGRQWTAALGASTIVTCIAVYAAAVSGNLLVAIPAAAVGLACALMCIKSARTGLSLGVSKRSGRVACGGTWMRQQVRWTKTADEFVSVQLCRPSDGRSLYVRLVPRDGVPMFLRSRTVAQSMRPDVASALASRIGEALQMPVVHEP